MNDLVAPIPIAALSPSTLKGRVEVHRWLLLATTELEQPLCRISKHTSIYPEDKRLPADVPLAAQEFKDMAKVLEAHMGGRKFVAADRVTVADFVLAYTLDWGNELKLLGDSPRLAAYLERMYARPKAAMRIAQAFASLRA